MKDLVWVLPGDGARMYMWGTYGGADCRWGGEVRGEGSREKA